MCCDKWSTNLPYNLLVLLWLSWYTVEGGSEKKIKGVEVRGMQRAKRKVKEIVKRKRVRQKDGAPKIKRNEMNREQEERLDLVRRRIGTRKKREKKMRDGVVVCCLRAVTSGADKGCEWRPKSQKKKKKKKKKGNG
ncbi:MAG: hypothetical protein J3R72DRAFT_220118 [Linnemannia gamsii]|nr:MAG: hypothetical protein J3R72DRAFT_220118 [Linnemannia gamsii]